MKKRCLGFPGGFHVIDWITQPVFLILVNIFISLQLFAQPSPTGIGWLRWVIKNGAKLVYYQPQVKDWKNYKEPGAGFALRSRQKEVNTWCGFRNSTNYC